MIVPSLIVVGAATGENVTKKGLLLTAIVGGVFTLVGVVIYAVYNEKEVLQTIRSAEKESK